MSEVALEEASVLSSIYCGAGEFALLQQSAQDGVVIQIACPGGGSPRQHVNLLFHLHPGYPSSAPNISVSSTALTRAQCHNVRRRLQERAAELPPEAMVHQLVEFFQEQCMELTESCRGAEQLVKPGEKDAEWTAVLMLDHMRSRNRYVGLLERWSQQLHLAGTLLMGQSILVILQGPRHSIKEFCHRLKTVKVDVDSSGRKCKERMMKVLAEMPSSSSSHHSLQGFVVKNYESIPELNEVFCDLNLPELYHHISASLKHWPEQK